MAPSHPPVGRLLGKTNADVIRVDKLLRDSAWSLGSVLSLRNESCDLDSSRHKCPIRCLLGPTRAGARLVSP